MKERVSRYVKGCAMCAKSKPSDRKLGLYIPLPVPSHPWESISMDFIGGLPKSRKGRDYLYVVVDRFSKMCILIPCSKQITVEQTAKLLFEHIQEIHQAVQEQLEKSQAKYKARHDKHRMEHSFQVGDQVSLYINKDKIQGEGKNLKPIKYGPFRILEKVGENAFRLDLPTYMHIYSVVKASFLRFFEPSMIEDPEEQSQLPSVDDLLPEYIDELQENILLDRKVRTTHSGQVEYLKIGLKGSKPSNAKWIEIGQVR
eukprot:PITA_17425